MKRVLMSVFAVVVLASPAAAQEDLLSSCGDLTVQYSPAAPPFGQAEIQSQLQFLCGQVVNALTNVQPTIGIGFTGGSAGQCSPVCGCCGMRAKSPSACRSVKVRTDSTVGSLRLSGF